jgi:acetyl esterase/lipase
VLSLLNTVSMFVGSLLATLASRFCRFSRSTFEYGLSGGRSLRLDLYLPRPRPRATGTGATGRLAGAGSTDLADSFEANEANERGFPLLIWAHGGGWRYGSRRMVERGFLRQVARGYALASISYSLSDTAKWPVQAHESKAAVRWLRAHADELGLDPACFIACGLSAGAHLASIVGLTSGNRELEGDVGVQGVSSGVQGVVACCGPYDLEEIAREGGFGAGLVNGLTGAPAATADEAARCASPVRYVDSAAPPFYLVHGSWDRAIHAEQSAQMQRALSQQGVDVDCEIVPGYLHADPRFNRRVRMRGVEAFLDSIAHPAESTAG